MVFTPVPLIGEDFIQGEVPLLTGLFIYLGVWWDAWHGHGG